MKLHSFVAEIAFFLLILLVFVCPQFFYFNMQINPEYFTAWKFPYAQLILALFGFALYLFFYEKQERKMIVFPLVFTVSLLFCVALFIKFFSSLPAFYQEAEIQVSRPDSLLAWAFCLLNFFSAAFYEEIIYRFYLTDALYSLISRKAKARFWLYFAEVFAGLCFAAAHLYLGVFSVINAAFAHVILRLCYKKTGSIWPGVTAHFIYNVISLILL